MSTVLGTSGNDTKTGSLSDDVIKLFGGHDIVYAFSGDDTVYGGTGNDTLSGDAGDDTLFGEGGADSLLGSAGTDRSRGVVATGGAGNDFMPMGGLRDSVIYAGSGDDQGGFTGEGVNLYGGAGNDLLEVDLRPIVDPLPCEIDLGSGDDQLDARGWWGVGTLTLGDGKDDFWNWIDIQPSYPDFTGVDARCTITDFVRGQDKLHFEVSGDELPFAAFDTNGSGVLNDADAYTSVAWRGSGAAARPYLTFDLKAAVNAETADTYDIASDRLTLSGISLLTVSDFVVF